MTTIQPYSLEGFKEFIRERREIYYKKEVLKSPAPFTKDEILATEKFCNIDRENDHQTKYYRDCIKGRDIEYQIISAYIFRLGRSASTLCVAFREIDNLKDLVEHIRRPEFSFTYEGKRIGTSPYFVPIVDNYRKLGEDKDLGNMKWLFKQVYEQREDILNYFYSRNHSTTPMEMVWDMGELIDTPRKLPFYYHQIIADNSIVIPEIINPRGYTYMAVGARKGIEGIKRMSGWSRSKLPNTDKWYLYDEGCRIRDYVEEDFFTIEHSVCEYNKYSSYVLGERERKFVFSKTRNNPRLEF